MDYYEKRQYNEISGKLKTLLGYMNHNKRLTSEDKEYIEGFEHTMETKAELIDKSRILKAKEELLLYIDIATANELKVV